MNNQRFINIVLIVSVLILVGAVGYFALVKKSPAPTSETQPTNNPTVTTASPKAVDLKSLLPGIQIALKKALPSYQPSTTNPISINGEVYITGDGVPEAVVDLGSGATTDSFTLVRIKNNKPVVSLFKQKDGKVSTLVFTDGAGGAGRYASKFEILKNNAIYSASYYIYLEGSDYCRAEMYQWNSHTKIFEYNTGLSNKAQQDFCRPENLKKLMGDAYDYMVKLHPAEMQREMQRFQRLH